MAKSKSIITTKMRKAMKDTLEIDRCNNLELYIKLTCQLPRDHSGKHAAEVVNAVHGNRADVISAVW